MLFWRRRRERLRDMRRTVRLRNIRITEKITDQQLFHGNAGRRV
jgi:hypothetical protein